MDRIMRRNELFTSDPTNPAPNPFVERAMSNYVPTCVVSPEAFANLVAGKRIEFLDCSTGTRVIVALEKMSFVRMLAVIVKAAEDAVEPSAIAQSRPRTNAPGG